MTHTTTAARRVKRRLSGVGLWTDGATYGTNPGPGGWAAILTAQGVATKELSGMVYEFHYPTTNNRMELEAVIQGLMALKRRCHVHVFTDSAYAIGGFESGWVVKWRATGWLTHDLEPVKNQDLWESLADLVARHDVEWTHVKSHSGWPLNERADALAKLAAERAYVARAEATRADTNE